MNDLEASRTSDSAMVGAYMPLQRPAMPMEESSKLNMLIDEYRRENDRCSRRIGELQHKLSATANRRIRNETYAPPPMQSSNNTG